jgi:hypothetical protein
MRAWDKPMEVGLITETFTEFTRPRAEPRIAGMGLMVLVAV